MMGTLRCLAVLRIILMPRCLGLMTMMEQILTVAITTGMPRPQSLAHTLWLPEMQKIPFALLGGSCPSTETQAPANLGKGCWLGVTVWTEILLQASRCVKGLCLFLLLAFTVGLMVRSSIVGHRGTSGLLLPTTQLTSASCTSANRAWALKASTIR